MEEENGPKMSSGHLLRHIFTLTLALVWERARFWHALLFAPPLALGTDAFTRCEDTKMYAFGCPPESR